MDGSIHCACGGCAWYPSPGNAAGRQLMLRCAALSNTRLAQVLFSRWNLRPGSRQSGRHDIHLRRKVQHAASGLFIVAAHTLLGSRVQGTGFQLTPCMHVVFRGSPCPAAMGLVTQLLQSCSVLLPLASVCTRFADVTRRSTGGTCSSLVPFSDRTSGMPCQVRWSCSCLLAHPLIVPCAFCV